MKFIHTADLHIDSPLRGLRNRNELIAAKIQTAGRDAFSRLVERALQERVAFVVVAGDLFDGAWDSINTGLWTVEQFKRLEEASICVFIAFGNHDLKNKILKNVGFPKNVFVFSSSAPQTFLYPDVALEIFPERALPTGERVALTGQSYPVWNCADDLAAGYPDARPDAFNIGVLHTGMNDADEAYAPTTLDVLRSKGYRYWALGHRHRPEVLEDSRNCWIGYSGGLQARHVNESESRGFFLAEIADERLASSPDFVCADSFRWRQIELDLTDVDDEDALKDFVKERVADVLDECDGRPVALRARLTGRSPLYDFFIARGDGAKKSKKKAKGKAAEYESGIDDSWGAFIELAVGAGDRLWVESVDWSELRPVVPEDYWRRGAVKSIKARVDERLRALDAAEDADAVVMTELEKEYAPLFEIFQRAKGTGLDGARAELVDLSDPRVWRDWHARALDALADVLTREDD